MQALQFIAGLKIFVGAEGHSLKVVKFDTDQPRDYSFTGSEYPGISFELFSCVTELTLEKLDGVMVTQ